MNKLQRILQNLPAGITKIDVAEAVIVASGGGIEYDWGSPALARVVHRFTPGLYSRKIFLSAGSLLTSRIHKTEHQFVVLRGRISVYSDSDGEQLLESGHSGVTLANTRRVLYAHEDTEWITFHPTETTDMDALERELFSDRKNPMLQENCGGLLGGAA